LVGFEQKSAELKELGVAVATASVDPIDKAQIVADEVNFPVGYGVTRDIAETLGSWWEDRRQIIQPTEFVLDGDDTVLAASYSDGPLGRILADDVLAWVRHRNAQMQK
jgi:peroxiredoxin